MENKIKEIVNQNFEELVALREHLHRNPELSNQEYKTQQLIIDFLSKLTGVEVHKTAETGVVAIIKGKKEFYPNPVIALRADIDALAIQDEKTCGYQSLVKGVMHACGHDVHTVILLGVAKVLNTIQNDFSGTVKLFFQPAEETTGGALRMIQAGWLDNPKVEAVFGLHVDPSIPVGSINYRQGPLFASSDLLKIFVKGKASHAGYPEEGVDAIVVASEIVLGLQTIVSRKVSFSDEVVLSFGKITGGEVINALAKEVIIEGTLRTFDSSIREKVLSEINHIASHIASAHHAEAKVEVTQGYPVLSNDKAMVDHLIKVGNRVLGDEKVLERKKPSAGSDDFAYFSQMVSSCYYLLGVANIEKGINYPLHTPFFDVDLQAIYLGCIMQTMITLSYLMKV